MYAAGKPQGENCHLVAEGSGDHSLRVSVLLPFRSCEDAYELKIPISL